MRSRRSISTVDIWAESVCYICGKRILKGDARFCVLFVDLGIGPGHPNFSSQDLADERVWDHDEEGLAYRNLGLNSHTSRAQVFCHPCAGNSQSINIDNPWFFMRAANMPSEEGRSVKTISFSEAVGSAAQDLEDNPHGAYQEAVDSMVSGAPSNLAAAMPVTEDDYRLRMAAFLATNPYKMRGQIKIVAQEFAAGKKQTEIAQKLGVTQSAVSKQLAVAKRMLYSMTG